MKCFYEQRRKDRALLGHSMANGGEILCFAGPYLRAPVAMEVRKSRGALIQPLLQLSNDAGF